MELHCFVRSLVVLTRLYYFFRNAVVPYRKGLVIKNCKILYVDVSNGMME